MKPAAEKLKAALAELTLAAPLIPVINNIDVTVQTDADAIRDALYRQAFGRCAGWSACRPSRLAASPTSWNVDPARCWPAWSSVLTPT
jgi:[acyl-carrier-protein] S-malonyltransferase